MLRMWKGDKTMLNNIDISGMGKIAGGEYNNVNISGMVKIWGDIKANNVEVSGKGESLANMEVNSIDISGMFKVLGDVKSMELLNSSGSFKVLKSISANKINISGTLKCLEGVNFDFIELSGWFKCKKDCEGRKICGEGKIDVEGLLSADEIDIKLLGRSNVNEIGGENIKIKAGKESRLKIFIFNYKQKNELVCNLIEGDNIEIENTTAKIVRGNNITIGRNCKVEKVEYSGELSIAEGSFIKEKISI